MIPKYIAQAICQTWLEPQQGLNGHFINLFETTAIHTGEILNFKFFDQKLICITQKHFSHDPVWVKVCISLI